MVFMCVRKEVINTCWNKNGWGSQEVEMRGTYAGVVGESRKESMGRRWGGKALKENEWQHFTFRLESQASDPLMISPCCVSVTCEVKTAAIKLYAENYHCSSAVLLASFSLLFWTGGLQFLCMLLSPLSAKAEYRASVLFVQNKM